MKTLQTAFTLCFLFSFGAIKSGDKASFFQGIASVRQAIQQISTHQGMITFIATIRNHQDEGIREAGSDVFEALTEQLQNPVEYNLVSTQNQAITNIEEIFKEYEEDFDAEQTRSIFSDMCLEMVAYAQHLHMINQIETTRINFN